MFGYTFYHLMPSNIPNLRVTLFFYFIEMLVFTKGPA